MGDMTIVEKVARALAAHEQENWDATNFNETMGGNEPGEMREHYMDLAHAAISAMREPTEKMKRAIRSVRDLDDGPSWTDNEKVYAVAIDAALNEAPQ